MVAVRYTEKDDARMREALETIVSIATGYTGGDAGRLLGYRLMGQIARTALDGEEPKVLSVSPDVVARGQRIMRDELLDPKPDIRVGSQVKLPSGETAFVIADYPASGYKERWLEVADGKVYHGQFREDDLVLHDGEKARVYEGDLGVALTLVADERRRQSSPEGEDWTSTHDDCHTDGSLAQAAAWYALSSVLGPAMSATNKGIMDVVWPVSWNHEWKKPRGAMRDLVRAGALILAEIERIKRLERNRKKEK